MPDLPRQIRLAAGDYFMHGQDRRMRRVGLPGNVCCAVIRLGPGLDVERLRRRIADFAHPGLAGARADFPSVSAAVPPLWRTLGQAQGPFFSSTTIKTAARTAVVVAAKWSPGASCTRAAGRDWRLT